MRARKLQDGEAAAAGELTVTATDGQVNGLRLAFKPDQHKECQGTGRRVADVTINQVTHKAGTPCGCVLKAIDAEFHGATYEIDYRTPVQRLEDRIKLVTERINGLKAKQANEVGLRRDGIREAREASAKAGAELEDTEPLLHEAEDQSERATKLVAETRSALREAEAGERDALLILSRVREQREAASRIQTANESSVKALEVDIARLEIKYQVKVQEAEVVRAELQERLAKGY